jgi:hypothetical protein
MSVATKNPFAILDGLYPSLSFLFSHLISFFFTSPLHLYSKYTHLHHRLPTAEDPSRPSSPTPAAPKEAPPVPPAPSRGAQKPRGGPAARGGKYYARGGAKSGIKESGNLNQNGIEEPATDGQRKCELTGSITLLHCIIRSFIVYCRLTSSLSYV